MKETGNDIRRSIPQMNKLLAWPELTALQDLFGEHALKQAARNVIDDIRKDLAAGTSPALEQNALVARIHDQLHRAQTPHLHPIINGSGVVVHTNLGRSPLAKSALQHLETIARGYSNLEYDVAAGERGERYVHVEELLTELTGAEAALVVNNNAAAVLLTLSALAAGREAIVSRGELVEIGGAFRIPEVMRQSGVGLVEVGTTNRTHLTDYANAISEQTALLVQVHTSNFAIVGFTSAVSTMQLASLSQKTGVPFVVDAGSGSLVDLAAHGIPGEATVRSYLAAGADLVTFSGDKLLGGPQAGIIVGKSTLITQLKRHQLLRALRIDKLTLAALEATLLLYRTPERAFREIPTLAMLTAPLATLQKKAQRLRRQLSTLLRDTITTTIVTGASSPGGGTFPLIELPTFLVQIKVDGWSAARLETALRQGSPSIVGRVYQDAYHLDVRTLTSDDFPHIAQAIVALTRCSS